LLVSGNQDPILPLDNAKHLANQLETAGAFVTHETLNTGHSLTQNDLTLAVRWLATQG
jgi:phospholipase/carboxylesterase